MATLQKLREQYQLRISQQDENIGRLQARMHELRAGAESLDALAATEEYKILLDERRVTLATRQIYVQVLADLDDLETINHSK
jgi:hypothetical protein